MQSTGLGQIPRQVQMKFTQDWFQLLDGNSLRLLVSKGSVLTFVMTPAQDPERREITKIRN